MPRPGPPVPDRATAAVKEAAEAREPEPERVAAAAALENRAKATVAAVRPEATARARPMALPRAAKKLPAPVQGQLLARATRRHSLRQHCPAGPGPSHVTMRARRPKLPNAR